MKNLKEKIFKILNKELFSKINILDLSISLKELSLLLKSNITMVEAIRLVALSTNSKKIKNIFLKIYDDLLNGLDLYLAFKERKVFDNLFLSLVKSGEASEKLSDVFLYLSNFYEKKYKLKEKIVSIMIYPMILLVVTTTVLVFLLNNVIPMFLEIFTQSNIKLPPLTLFLISFTNFFKNNYLFMILGFLSFLIFIKLIKKIYKVKLFLGKMLFKIPYFKVHYQNYITSIIAKNLTILLKGNVDIIESLNIIKNSVNNVFIKEYIQEVIFSVTKGNSISKSLDKKSIFNFSFISMILIGEESENLVDILESGSEYYEQKINYSVEKILQYLGPILIIIISIFISFVVFSIAIPIFDLSNGITIN